MLTTNTIHDVVEIKQTRKRLTTEQGDHYDIIHIKSKDAEGNTHEVTFFCEAGIKITTGVLFE